MPPIVVSSSSTQPITSPAHLWVLAIGVDRCQGEKLPLLKYAAADCQNFAEALASVRTTDTSKTFLTHHSLSDRPPQRTAVLESLEQIVAQSGEKDTIVFYFSGHALVLPGFTDPFLCLADTNPAHLQTTGLGLSQILQHLSHSPARRKLLILDACHSGAVALRDTQGKLYRPPAQASPAGAIVKLVSTYASQTQGVYALLSCDRDQYAWELPDLQQGVFTHYLIRGLKGEAADAKGKINFDQLYKYVYYQTIKHIDKINQQIRLLNQQKLKQGDRQLLPTYPTQAPRRTLAETGEWVIGWATAAPGSQSARHALVLDGLVDHQLSLEISKILQTGGQFELQYWPQPRKSAQVTQTAIQQWFQEKVRVKAKVSQTLLILLRGTLQDQADGESYFVMPNGARFSRSWLRQRLRKLNNYQQILVLDCPGADTSLQDWVDDLRSSEFCQCLIAAASPATQPELFTTALLNTLPQSADEGLSVAGWITGLQMEVAKTEIKLLLWLPAVPGEIIEVVPEQSLQNKRTTADLNLCPYMGLSAFTEAEANYFYGRDKLTQQLIHLLNYRNFVAVIGASGSGKSSVVQAGLLAQLRQGKHLPGSSQWWLGSFRTGTEPFAALKHCLLTSSSNTEPQPLLQPLTPETLVQWLRTRPEPMVVLVVDQFEELFTLSPPEERDRLLDLLFNTLEHADDRFKLVITIRADFIAACLEVPVLARKFQGATVLVSPQLTAAEYEQVIVQPAAKVGLQVEPELVRTLIQELEAAAVGLPILEFVLEQLWLNRQSGRLSLQAYQQTIGGIRGALERRAQNVYDHLTPAQQTCAQWIFLSLVQLGVATEDTRRRVAKSVLQVPRFEPTLLETTLQALATHKLIVISGSDRTEPSVEIVHEVLIRYWTTLRHWLEEERVRLRLQRQVEFAAQQWHTQGRQADYLLRGVLLQEAEELYDRYSNEFSLIGHGFIAASQEARAIQLAQEKKIREDGVQALNLIAVAHFNAHRQIEALQSSREAAEKLRQIAQPDPQLLRETWQTLHHISSSVQEFRRLEGHEDAVSSLSFCPKGNLLASGSFDRCIKIWKLDGQEVTHFVAHDDAITDIVFTPDHQIISASKDQSVKLWTLGGELLQTWHGESLVRRIALSPSARLLAIAQDKGQVSLWCLDETPGVTFLADQEAVYSVAFNPAGQELVTGGEDGEIKFWNLEGTFCRAIAAHDKLISALSISPDGHTLVSASDDRTLKLWDLRTDTLIATLENPSQRTARVRFSPDGREFVTCGFDRLIKHWSCTGTLLDTFTGHAEAVLAVEFSPDATVIASAAADRQIKLWYSQNPLKVVLREHQGFVNSLSFCADRSVLATAGYDGTIRMWTTAGQLLNSFAAHHTQIVTVNFSSDGQLLLSASFDQTARLWDRNGQLLQIFAGHTDFVYGAIFCPDSQRVTTASGDGSVRLWERSGQLIHTLTTDHGGVIALIAIRDQIIAGYADGTLVWWGSDGCLIRSVQAHQNMILGLTVSPDQTLFASASEDRQIKLWKPTGELVCTFPPLQGPAYSVNFSPDGQLLAVASAANTIQLWGIDGTPYRSMTISKADPCVAVSFDHQQNLLAVGAADGAVYLIPCLFELENLLLMPHQQC